MRVFKEVPLRVLCIFAHPDDADVGAGGTIAKWSSAGAIITLVVACKGEKGTVDASIPSTILAETRDLELKLSADTLGISSIEKLLIDDGEVENNSLLRTKLVTLIRSFKPQIVLSHDPTAIFFGATYFNHRDHRELGFAVLDSVLPASHLPHYFPEAGPAHSVERVFLSGTQNPTISVDVSSTIKLKVKAALCHKSQVGMRSQQLSDSIKESAKHLGKRVGVECAEYFRDIANGRGSFE